MSETQKDIFLGGEADAWFARNAATLAARKLPDDSPVLRQMMRLPDLAGKRVLEVGCGDGHQLAFMRDTLGMETFGIEPSAEAVAVARAKGLEVVQGTADALAFPEDHFDVVIFGFCLYLCDRADLFAIAHGADRVLRTPGWLLIQDFFTEGYGARAYHHRAGLASHKMDYRRLFDWHPHYTCTLMDLRDHASPDFTDIRDNQVMTAVLRKSLPEAG